MGLLDYLDVRRKVKSLEDALCVLMEDQDEMHEALKALNFRICGVQGSIKSKEVRASKRFLNEEQNLIEKSEAKPEASEMTEEQFMNIHGMTPKEFADQQIRSGKWR